MAAATVAAPAQRHLVHTALLGLPSEGELDEFFADVERTQKKRLRDYGWGAPSEETSFWEWEDSARSAWVADAEGERADAPEAPGHRERLGATAQRAMVAEQATELCQAASVKSSQSSVLSISESAATFRGDEHPTVSVESAPHMSNKRRRLNNRLPTQRCPAPARPAGVKAFFSCTR